MYRRRSDRRRNVYCDLRVGSPHYDQITSGGLEDNDEERESEAHVRVPIDDRVYDGLRLGLWRLSEAKFKEALSDFSHKEASRISTVDPASEFRAFTPFGKCRSVRYERPEPFDEEAWVKFCKRASAWMAELPHISSSLVQFDASQETRVFVNTENRVIVQHSRVYALIATFRKLTREGVTLEQEVVINCGSLRELPDMRRFKRLALEKYERLLKLIHARQIHAFSGPVLLAPGPAGLLFHEAIGHRLEASRLVASGEGQTFKGQKGKKVLGVELSISDNPRLKTFKGQRCIGAYDYDDEGVPSKNTPLVDSGMLKDFLSTRAPWSKGRFEPNGHARNSKSQRPISRMGVTIIQGKQGHPFAKLKELLIQQIKSQNKPFGMIVYDTSGGETETVSYDFQAFSGEISYATLVYPNGREVVIRGVNFVGTPLQALHHIVAVGDQQELDNSFCGAESGMVPVTTIAPAILLSSLELQAKDEEVVTQYVLPKPRFRKPKRRKASRTYKKRGSR